MASQGGISASRDGDESAEAGLRFACVRVDEFDPSEDDGTLARLVGAPSPLDAAEAARWRGVGTATGADGAACAPRRGVACALARLLSVGTRRPASRNASSAARAGDIGRSSGGASVDTVGAEACVVVSTARGCVAFSADALRLPCTTGLTVASVESRSDMTGAGLD